MAKITQKDRKFQQFLKVQPKAISLPSSEELIKLDYLESKSNMPLVVSPALADVNIIDWIESNHQLLKSKLHQHGAILFRNCNLTSIADFENLTQAICSDLHCDYGDLPPIEASNKVYNVTPFPADKTILFHNESSHLHCYPQKIWFFCMQPAEVGGETPIVDCRQVYQLLNPKVRAKLQQKKLMYVRNYIEGLDVSWQDFFRTESKAAVEKYCHTAKIEYEWLPNNGLRTRKTRPAIIQHPDTKDTVFFNQIQLHHISYLDQKVRQSLLSIFTTENLPRNVYYGDGSPIEEEEIVAINQAYQQAKVSFTWQKGDVLMLDNILTAHSRNPYQGKRKVFVAMGDLVRCSDVAE
ncbi:MAG: TauD/TfdA family dioxygenase [Cyanobacteria bacterium P01_G01_bin.39]